MRAINLADPESLASMPRNSQLWLIVLMCAAAKQSTEVIFAPTDNTWYFSTFNEEGRQWLMDLPGLSGIGAMESLIETAVPMFSRKFGPKPLLPRGYPEKRLTMLISNEYAVHCWLHYEPSADLSETILNYLKQFFELRRGQADQSPLD